MSGECGLEGGDQLPLSDTLLSAQPKIAAPLGRLFILRPLGELCGLNI